MRGAPEPPPTSATSVAVWCGASKGGTVMSRPPDPSRPATEWIGGDLQRGLRVERRQQPRQPLGEHRLPDPRQPGHGQVVTAGGGELQRRPGVVLAAHVGEVGHLPLVGGRDRRLDLGVDLDVGRRVAADERDQPGEGAHPLHVEVGHERGLLDVGRGHDQPGRARGPRRQGRDQRATHRAHPAVEAELADHDERRDPIARDLTAGGEQRQRDGEIEGRAALGQLGRATAPR